MLVVSTRYACDKVTAQLGNKEPKHGPFRAVSPAMFLMKAADVERMTATFEMTLTSSKAYRISNFSDLNYNKELRNYIKWCFFLNICLEVKFKLYTFNIEI